MWGQIKVGDTMWSEPWTGTTSGTKASTAYDMISSCSTNSDITYSTTGTVKLYYETYASGTAPELYIKSGGTWTISNIPTGGAKELALTYKSNNTKSSVTCSTTGASISGSSKSYTITTGGAATITLVFGCSGNTRIDDVSLTVKSLPTPTTYTVTYAANGGSGTMTDSSSPYAAGAEVTLLSNTFTAPSGKTWNSWAVTDASSNTVSVSNGKFTMPSSNVTVTAQWADITHTLTYSATNGSIGGVVYGTSTAVASGASVAEGGKVTLTATPASGYTFSGWSVSGTGSALSSTTDNPTTFTMGTANSTVTANFVATSGTPTYTLTITPPTGGTITVKDSEDNAVSSGDKFEENAELTLSAAASTGYTFTTWTKTAGTFGSDATTASNTFTMPASAATIGATFTLNTHSLSITSSNGTCATTVNGETWDGSSAIPYDATVVSTATPNSGYQFSSWTCSYNTVTTNGNEISFTMPDADVTLTANYSAIPTHTATFSVNGVTSSQTVAEGAAIPFPADPADISGKKFVGWYTSTYSDVSTAPSFVTSATMSTSDVTYYAVYAEVTGSTDASWTETAIGSLTSSDIFVIVGNDGSTYALPNGAQTSGNPSVSSVSVSGTNLTTTPISDDIKWNITGNSKDGYIFYPNGSTNKWLYLINNNKGVCVGTGDAKHFKLSNGYLSTSETTSTRYIGIYTSTDWRCYTSTDGNIANQTFAFYKYIAASTTYANYSTSVEVIYTVTYDANGATSGDVPTDDNEYSEEDEVTVLGNTGNLEKTNYIFSGWNTQNDGEGTDYDKDDTFEITSDVTLYAKWTEKTNSDLAITSSSPVALEMTSANTSPTSTIAWTTSSDGTMSFVSDDTGVATVTSAGVITAVSEGTAKITISQAASASYKASSSFEVTVNVTDNRSVCATGINLPTAQKTLTKGGTDDFAATSTKADGFTGSITYTYETSNSSVVSVATGTYSADGLGTADITITATPIGGNAANYKPASQVVSVKVNGTNSISLDPTSKTVTYSTSTFDIAATVPTDNYNGTVNAESDNEDVATVSVDGTTITVTPHAVGSAKITVTAGTDTYYPETAVAECNVTITAPAGSATAPSNVETVFEETFDKCEGNGGNDDSWSGVNPIAVSDKDYDGDAWTTSKMYASNKCLKGGTGSAGGSATTPNLTLEEGVVYTLTFKAAAWNATNESTSLGLSATNATLTDDEENTVSSVTTSKGEWASYTVYVQVVDESENATITFSTSSGNSRFFLDEVKVTKAGPTPTATVTLNKYGYATYCSQYPIDFSSTEGYTAWRVSSIEDGVISFAKITEKIKGGQGVLLYNKNADGENTSSATIKFADGTTEFDEEKNLLVGTTAPTYFVEDSFYGLSGNQFLKNNTCTLHAGKAYLPYDKVDTGSGVRNFTFVFEDDVTGIETIQNVSDEVIFDMTGRRLNRLQKGVNIVNGKKILVK